MTEDETEPDSPDAIDLTQGDGHWTDERDGGRKPVEEMTPEEIREKYPKRAEEIINDLEDVEGSKVAELREQDD